MPRRPPPLALASASKPPAQQPVDVGGRLVARADSAQRREATAEHRHARGARERLGAVDVGVGEVRERDAARGGRLGAAVYELTAMVTTTPLASVSSSSAFSSSSGGASHSSAVAESHRVATTVAPKRQRRSSPTSTKPRPATSTRVPPPRAPAGGDALDRRRRQVAERHAAHRQVGAAVRAHLERERARAARRRAATPSRSRRKRRGGGRRDAASTAPSSRSVALTTPIVAHRNRHRARATADPRARPGQASRFCVARTEGAMAAALRRHRRRLELRREGNIEA